MSEAEVKVRDMESLKYLAHMYKPYVVLHPEEPDFPVDVNDYLREAKLKPNRGVTVDPRSQANLPDEHLTPRSFHRLLVDPRNKNGFQTHTLYLPGGMNSLVIQSSASMFSQHQPPYYVRIHATVDAVYLIYCFFYAYNGPARVFGSRAKWMHVRAYEHYADIEHITLKFASRDLKLLGVYGSQHSGGRWYSPDDVEWKDRTHPRIYSALYSHASYVSPGYHGRFWHTVGDECKDSNRVWFPRKLVFLPGSHPPSLSLANVQEEAEEEEKGREQEEQDEQDHRWIGLYRGDMGEGRVSAFASQTFWHTPEEPSEHHGEQCCFCNSI
jgi:hypothetical protein